MYAATESMIVSLRATRIPYKGKEIDGNEENSHTSECAICITEYQLTDSVITMPCH